MIPLRDNIPSSRFPVATIAIIVLNGLAFLHELKLGPHLQDTILLYGVVPVRYTSVDVARLFSFQEQILAIFTSMFLHGGWVHLLGNMWVLWIFGDNVEDRLGHVRYVVLYLAGGIAAAVLHIYTNAGSTVPTIGASGAIAGIMGSYFRFYPSARVETLVPPFIFGPVFELPAVLFLGWWFLLQFFNGALSLGARGHNFSGVAWWAHVGGFLFGFAVCLLARRRRRASPNVSEL
jgi:membrane associated rhomboid family serine protease